MKPAKIEVDLGVLGAATLRNVEKHNFVDEYNREIIYSGFTRGLRIYVVKGETVPYTRHDTIYITTDSLKNHQEITQQEEEIYETTRNRD